jgi:hypothetical protein
MNKSTAVLGSASELMLKSPPLFREVRERKKEKMVVTCCVQREREKEIMEVHVDHVLLSELKFPPQIAKFDERVARTLHPRVQGDLGAHFHRDVVGVARAEAGRGRG